MYHESPVWKGYGEISGSFYAHIKNHALKREHQFDVSIEFLWELFLRQERRCVYSGVELVMLKRRGDRDSVRTASLDRIDSALGYLPGNVQWVHKRVNNIKLDLGEAEFLRWCRLITTHSFGNQLFGDCTGGDHAD